MPPALRPPGPAQRRRSVWAADAVASVLRSPAGRPALLGLVGAACLTLGGLGSGAKPRTGAFVDWPRLTAVTTGVAQFVLTCVVWAGVLLMLLAWVRLGRAVLAGRVALASLRWIVVLWTAPMLLALPMFSRDVYSYLAQGALLRDGLDPYAVGPDAHPGPLTESVSPVWRSTTAPYGPAFLLLARGVTTLTGDHVVIGTYAMRLALLPGLALLVWALPRIAGHLRGNSVVALWLGVLNPLVLVHLVAGSHNDLPMLGLLLAGLVLALDGRHLSGVAMISLAATVKATAGVALPFVVWIWVVHARERAREAGRPVPPLPSVLLRAAGSGIAMFAAVFAAVTLAAGVGFGWVTALAGSTQTINWLSLPTAVSQLAVEVSSWFGPVSLDSVLPVARTVSAVLLAVLVVVVWVRSRHSASAAVRGLAVTLAALALLSPATLPWYYTWSLVVAAGLALSRRAVVVLVALSTWLILVYQPAGDTALYRWPQVVAAVAAALLVGWSLVREDPPRPRARRRAASASRGGPPVP